MAESFHRGRWRLELCRRLPRSTEHGVAQLQSDAMTVAARRAAAMTERCETCGYPLWLNHRSRRELPVLGDLFWCPSCGMRELKYVGLVINYEGVRLLFVCKHCGTSRTDLECIEVQVRL